MVAGRPRATGFCEPFHRHALEGEENTGGGQYVSEE